MGLRDRNLYNDKHTFFITTTCYKWLPLLKVGNGFEILAESVIFISKKYKIEILGYVFMPNHIHMIMHFENPEVRSAAMRGFKKFTSTHLRKEIENHSSELLNRIEIRKDGRIFKVWMDRFDEVYLEDRKLLEVKLDYIHANPLQEKWNLVAHPEDYEFSSAGFYELGKDGPLPVTDYREVF